MVKKGLISKSMMEEEMKELLNDDKNAEAAGEDEQKKNPCRTKDKRKGGTNNNPEKGRDVECLSEITVYRPAVQVVNNSLNDQIDDLLNRTRKNEVSMVEKRKVSLSSEDFMDTSDEIGDNNNSPMNISDPKEKEVKLPSPEYQAAKLIQDAENSRARMFDVPGKDLALSAQLIDEDYCMIDSYVDKSFKKKIQNFEYIDFSRLINKNRTVRDDERQRIEIINHNGMSFLSPVANRDSNISINSYGKWEQAFRVYSNILTTRFLGKSPELLQYNHTIHSAAMSYQWDNVYAYDKEFRQHIARHPCRSWSVILQQAWTMLLKDRLKGDNSSYYKNNNSNNRSGQKEICKRFNKGQCTYGLSCRYDHRCAVPKCGKFGHGAHICRLRNSNQDMVSGAEGSNANQNNNNGNNSAGKK